MKKITSWFFLILLLPLLTSCGQVVQRPREIELCQVDLTIVIRQGPNAMRTISGQVSLGEQRRSGEYDSSLVIPNGSSLPISLSRSGRDIRFVVEIGQSNIYGSGMAKAIEWCSGDSGGTISGPDDGDLGDWRGTWSLKQEVVMVEVYERSEFWNFWLVWFCILPALAYMGMLMWFSRPYKMAGLFSKPARVKSASTANSLLRTKPQPGGANPPLVEYQAVYQSTDRLFDLSFQIEPQEGYLGECGLSVAKNDQAKPGQASAFEFWLFDAKNQQTQTKILAGSMAYGFMNSQFESVLLAPGVTVSLETPGLKASIRALNVEYETGAQGAFKKVSLNIEVWRKPAW